MENPSSDQPYMSPIITPVSPVSARPSHPWTSNTDVLSDEVTFCFYLIYAKHLK